MKRTKTRNPLSTLLLAILPSANSADVYRPTPTPTLAAPPSPVAEPQRRPRQQAAPTVNHITVNHITNNVVIVVQRQPQPVCGPSRINTTGYSAQQDEHEINCLAVMAEDYLNGGSDVQ